MNAVRSKIWVQLLLTVAAALAVVWAGVIAWEGQAQRSAIIEQARDFSLSMHEATMAGLTGMMVTGTMPQRGVFLDQVRQLNVMRDLRVVRAEAVSRTFGKGQSTEVEPDAVESLVLATGREIVEVGLDAQGEYLRAVRPASALPDYLGKNCLSCHQVPQGTVLGVVSMKLSLDRANASLARLRNLSVLAALLTCIPVLLLIYPFIQRVVTRPLARGVDVAQGIARGDLTQSIEVTSGNETGRLLTSLREMSESLARVVSRVRGGSASIAQTSTALAAGNDDLERRSNEQAEALREAENSLAQLSTAAHHNADGAQRAAALAAEASAVAGRGGEAVTRVVGSMDAINASATRMADVIGVIDRIAFQTNILALNAAVEASRAGEHGRGFAVVAGEVRALAQRSATAATEIKGLIERSVHEVRAGTELVHSAGATIGDVVQSVQRLTAIMGEIAAASRGQMEGVDQVNHAIGRLDGITQSNLGLVQQAASATQALQQQAESLEQIVRLFRLRDAG